MSCRVLWCGVMWCAVWRGVVWCGVVWCMDGWMNQAYSRLSTTHGHITDCKLDSVVYAGVCLVSEGGPVLFGPNDLRPTILLSHVDGC